MRQAVRVGLLAMMFVLAGEAAAQCVCGCIDGQVGIICRGPAQAQMECTPRVCPAPQLSAAPVLAARNPPPGATRCFMAQVLTPQTGRYEWTEVCR